MIRINLLPYQKSWARIGLKITGVLFLLTFFLQLGLDWSNGYLEQVIGNPKGGNFDFSFENERSDGSNEFERLQVELTTMNGIISRLTEGALTQQLSLLHRLARQLPENIWLTKIEVQDKGELFIQGESMDYETIICWIDILKGMEDVHQVKLLSFQGQEVLQFSIALEMGGGLG